MVVAVLRRPDLWATGIRAARTHAPPGWWKRRPWLPVPDRHWMQFRLTTAYGTGSAPADTVTPRAEPSEFIEWLEWLKAWPFETD